MVRDHNKDLFGQRRPFYDPGFIRDYYQADQRGEMAMMLRQAGYDQEADRYENCRQSFILSECADRCGDDPDNADRMFISPLSCHCRYCETCARIFGQNWRSRVLPYIKQLARSSGRRRFKHIVFEFKNPEKVTAAWLSDAMKIVARLIRKYCCPRSKRSKQFIGGAVAIIEMSPGGYFHVHCLAYCYYIDQRKMSADFLRWSGDSYRIWISDATGSRPAADDKKAERILAEVTKYITKPIRTPFIDELFDYAMAIKGRRRIHAWGLFYNNEWLKLEADRSTCPYCGALLKFLATSPKYDDGGILPAWYIRKHPEAAAAVDRYG